MPTAIDPEQLESDPGPAKGRLGGLLHRRATWVFADQAIASAGNFLTANLLIRNLPKTEWGVFTVLFETLLYLNGLQAALVIYPLLIRGARSDRANLGRLASASILLTLGLLPILGTATAISVGSLDAGPIVLSAVAALLLWQIQETTRRALMSHLRFAEAVWGDAVSYLGQAALIFVAARMQVLSINSAFLAMGLTSALAIAIQGFQIGLKPIGLRHLRDIAMEFWALGRWMLLSSASGLITSLSYWWVLRGAHGDEATAIFGAIVAMFKLANPVMSSIGSLILPAVARTSAEAGMRASIRVAWRYIALGATLLTPYFLLLGLAPELSLRLFYGSHTPYAIYGSLLALFVLNYSMKYGSDVFGAWLMGLGRSRQGFYTQLVNIAATLLIGLPATWLWGVGGLILGSMFAITCTAASAGYYLRRAMRPT